jgi:hypothetical protein
MPLRSICAVSIRPTIAIGAFCAGLLAAGCGTITTGYQSAGQPIQARAGQALVFGHVKVAGMDGTVYFPAGRGLATPSNPGLVEHMTPNLSLWKLRSPIAMEWGASTTQLKFEADGSLFVWVPAGDYELVLTSPTNLEHVRMEMVALIRVPADAIAAYAGELIITIAMEPTETFLDPQPYMVAGVEVESSAAAARNALEARFGPLPGPPAESLWCPPSPETRETMDYAVAIARLNAGCRSFETTPLPTVPR